MAGNTKTKKLAIPKDDPDAPEDIEAGAAPGVATSAVGLVAGSGTTGGSTSSAQVHAICERSEKPLRAHLRRIGVLSEDVEEVMQRTKAGLMEWGTHNDPPRDPLGLVRGIGTIQARSFWREQGRHCWVADDEGIDETPPPSSRKGLDQTLLRAERMQLVEKGIAKLRPSYATVIQKAYFEHMTHEEIAEELGITVDAAEKRYERGLEKLKKLVLCHCTNDDLEEGRSSPRSPVDRGGD